MVWECVLSFNTLIKILSLLKIFFFFFYHSLIHYTLYLPLCARFALSDGSSCYQTYIVFGDITQKRLVIERGTFSLSHTLSESFSSWYFTTVFSPSLQRALLAVSKEGCPPTRSLSFLSHTCNLALLVFRSHTRLQSASLRA